MKQIVLLLSVILVFIAACDVDTGPEIEDIPENPDETTADDKKDAENGQNKGSGSSDDTVEHENDGSETDDEVGFSGISKEQCQEANGFWNECGSPCAGTDADFCIELCQIQCECSGIAGFTCPKDFKCRLSGKFADEMGVCIPE